MRCITLIALATLMVVLLPFHAAEAEAQPASGSSCPIHDKIEELVKAGGTDDPVKAMIALGERGKSLFKKEDMKKAMAMSAADSKACQKDFDEAYRKKLKDADKSDEDVESFMKELYNLKKKGVKPPSGGSGKPTPVVKVAEE